MWSSSGSARKLGCSAVDAGATTTASTTASVAIGAGAGLVGVALGFFGNLFRDSRQERAAREEAKRELRAAARLVWMEIVAFETATHIAAEIPRLVKDETVIGPLRSEEQLQRYLVVLAREKDFDLPAIEHAYTSARYAADALFANAPPKQTRDEYQPAFARAMTALEPLAEINPEHLADVRRSVLGETPDTPA